MVKGPDLGAHARGFAQVLQDLLNRTMCDNAQVGALINRRSGNAHIGTRLSREDLQSDMVPMRTRARTKIWLDISSIWYLNDEGHLTAMSTYWGVALGDDRVSLMHYDYERDKEIYTEAHLQMHGSHPLLEQMLREVGRAGDRLSSLHFPVGGRRLRPSIEDVLEGLAAERLVEGRKGWEKVLKDSRREYRKIQIAAVVRSNQETAAAALRKCGWEVTRRAEPAKSSSRKPR